MKKPKKAIKLGKEKFVLGKKDAAIVVKGDGSTEIYMAAQKDDEEVYPSSMVIFKLAMMLDDKKLSKIVDKAVNKLLKSSS